MLLRFERKTISAWQVLTIQFIYSLLALNCSCSTTHKDILRPIGAESCTNDYLGYLCFLPIKNRLQIDDARLGLSQVVFPSCDRVAC